ncbi:hypothetical protein [Pseudomonas aeruginosa]|uniref:hypothetical protein n=1 Tax=Pseudomonas aeruginosa TaxID=287 RepID=UPI0013CE07BA|nr:hypothetical protein [Pseudomonas aeruginosa]HBO2745115.1 hypothetical protein [Pseudomonas aeruginosa]HDY6331752.1 hypothetical protein [Pseudomonas aeruginosa]
MSGNEETRKKLRSSFYKLKRESIDLYSKNGHRKKVSVSAVARLAGVSHALIYKTYPEILDLITGSNSALISREDTKEGKEKENSKNALKERIKELRKQNTELVSSLASARLRISELEHILRAAQQGVPFIRPNTET